MPPLLGVITSQTKRTSRANLRSYFSSVQFHFSSLVAVIIISSVFSAEKKQDTKELRKAKSNQLNLTRPKHTAEQTTEVRNLNTCVLHIFLLSQHRILLLPDVFFLLLCTHSHWQAASSQHSVCFGCEPKPGGTNILRAREKNHGALVLRRRARGSSSSSHPCRKRPMGRISTTAHEAAML